MRIEVETISKAMIEKGRIGLLMNLDSSPSRLFGIDKVAASHEVLARCIFAVGMDGDITAFAPRATVPYYKLRHFFYSGWGSLIRQRTGMVRTCIGGK